jgi:putative flavoprotein involved in K+ transport
VITERGDWWARSVVIATGAFNRPSIPACAAAFPGDIEQLSMQHYRNPDQLEDGGVLVVGASATGLQLAEEIHRSGRPVTLAVGEHVRLPRHYRGRDIQWWMKAVGVLDQCYDEVDDLQRARRVPSPQLIGSPEGRTLDLNALTSQGVKLAGRLATVRNGEALFSGSLAHVCELADLKMNRLLDTVDEWISAEGLQAVTHPAERFDPTRPELRPRSRIDLASGEFKTVLWATGMHPDYSWLEVPVLDQKGRIRHDGGVADAPGVYVLGLPFMRRRKSTFIHGAEDDTSELAEHLHQYLDRSSRNPGLLRLAV